MRRLALLLTAVMIVASFPLIAAASGFPNYAPPMPGGPIPPTTAMGQAYPAGPPPGPGGPPPMFGGSPCGPTGCEPAPCGSPSCAPMPTCDKGPALLGPASGYGGWLVHDKGVRIHAYTEENDLLGLAALEHVYSLSGFWAGASQQIPFGDNLQLLLKGSWLFPFETHTQEYYTLWAPTGVVPGERRWDAELQWYTLDASAAYLISPAAAVIGGFRFDSFDLHFKNPDDVVTIVSDPNDEGDATIHSYIPYAGVLVQLATCDSTTSASVIGFPHLFGDIKYRQTTSNPNASLRFESGTNWNWGYFVEARAEHTRMVSDGIAVGAFAEWELVAGKSKGDLDELATAASESFWFDIERKAWTFGGKVTIDFASGF